MSSDNNLRDTDPNNQTECLNNNECIIPLVMCINCVSKLENRDLVKRCFNHD